MTGPLDRLDSSRYGDLGDRPAGVGPPCDSCGEREAIREFDLEGREVALCGACVLEESDSQEPPS